MTMAGGAYVEWVRSTIAGKTFVQCFWRSVPRSGVGRLVGEQCEVGENCCWKTVCGMGLEDHGRGILCVVGWSTMGGGLWFVDNLSSVSG